MIAITDTGTCSRVAMSQLGRILLLFTLAVMLSGCFWEGSSKKKLKIVTEPADVTVVAGATANFSVAVNGGRTTYQWRRNGADIAGAISASYTTAATVAGDDGALYSAVVTRGNRSLTSRNARLTVIVPPSISAQPASATVAPGATATFSVTAAGTAPLSYQWRRGGTNIVGATSASYTTAATVDGDNGALFSVVVTNVAGSATSSNAMLTVTSPPVVSGVWGAARLLDNSDNQIGDSSIAIDPATGDAVTVWTQSPDGVHEGVYANVYDFSTNTWSGPQLLGEATLANSNEFTSGPRAAINGAGDIVVAWHQNVNQSTGTDGTIRAVRYKTGTGTGSGWSEVYQLTRVPGGPEAPITWTYDLDVAMDVAGNATVVWIEEYRSLNAQLVASARMPAAGGFLTAQLLESTVEAYYSEDVRVVMDSAGNATAVWLREKPAQGGRQVVTQRRPAGASAWGDEVLLAFLTQAGRLDYPRMAINPATGDILVAWRQEVPSADAYDIAYASYVAATSTWRTTALAESSPDEGGAVEVAVNRLGQGVLVWESYGATSDDIRAARLNLATGTLGAEIAVVANSYSPAVGIDLAGNVMVIYNDGLVRARRIAADNTLGSPVRLSDTSVETGIGGVGVADDGTAVAIWTQGFITGSGSYFTSNIYAKTFR